MKQFAFPGGSPPGSCALCLETEYFPDAPHHPAFPQPVLSPGEVYRAETVYRFTNLS